MQRRFRSRTGFQVKPPKQGYVPLGGARLVSIAEALGYRIGFQPAKLASGVAVYYVTLYRPGNSCLGRRKAGRFDELALLDDEALRAAMVAACAPKL